MFFFLNGFVARMKGFLKLLFYRNRCSHNSKYNFWVEKPPRYSEIMNSQPNPVPMLVETTAILRQPATNAAGSDELEFFIFTSLLLSTAFLQQPMTSLNEA